eukprot:TRINITY_DN24369_c0_g1_i1.p1 TRINITY_DN24369_c0_g1~~TRINITY_DN24369_c0_g1_i1.p1  ORF type:complete len:914 (+),score=214.54 TRINITY_DN24369_c0_g1_i1:40-2781(+)
MSTPHYNGSPMGVTPPGRNVMVAPFAISRGRAVRVKEKVDKRSRSSGSYFLDELSVVGEERDASVAYGLQLLQMLKAERKAATHQTEQMQMKLVQQTETVDDMKKEKDSTLHKFLKLHAEHKELTTRELYLSNELKAKAEEMAVIEAELSQLKAPTSPPTAEYLGSPILNETVAPKAPRVIQYYTDDYQRDTADQGVQTRVKTAENSSQCDLSPEHVPAPSRDCLDKTCTECGIGGDLQLVCTVCYHDMGVTPLPADPLTAIVMGHGPGSRHSSLSPKTPVGSVHSTKLGIYEGRRYSPSVFAGCGSPPVLTLSQELRLLECHDELLKNEEKGREEVESEEAVIRSKVMTELQTTVIKTAQNETVKAQTRHKELAMVLEEIVSHEQDTLVSEEEDRRAFYEEMEDEAFQGMTLESLNAGKHAKHAQETLPKVHPDESPARRHLEEQEALARTTIATDIVKKTVKQANLDHLLLVTEMMDMLCAEEVRTRSFIMELEEEVRATLLRSGESASSVTRLSQRLLRQTIESQHKKCRMEAQRYTQALVGVSRNEGYYRKSIEMKEDALWEQTMDSFKDLFVSPARSLSQASNVQRKPKTTGGKIGLSSFTGDARSGVVNNPMLISRMVKAARSRHTTIHESIGNNKVRRSSMATTNKKEKEKEPTGRWVESPTKALTENNHNKPTKSPGKKPLSMWSSNAHNIHHQTPQKRSASASVGRSASLTPSQVPIAHWAYDYDLGKEWIQLRETVLHASPSMGLKIAQITDSKDKEGIFKIAHQALKAVLSEGIKERSFHPGEPWHLRPEELEGIPRHGRMTVLRSLRELVCAYDMMRTTQKNSLLTVQEIQDNIPSLILLARWSQQAVYSPAKTPNTAVQRSVSASVHRSVTPPCTPSYARSRSRSPSFNIGRHSSYVVGN